MRLSPFSWRSVPVLVCALALVCVAGCAAPTLSLFSLLGSGLLALSLVLAACSDSHRNDAGTGGTSAGNGGSGGSAGVGGVGGTSGVGGAGGTGGEYCTTYTECTDGVPHDVTGCCPEGAACNYWSAEICADGSCVQPGEQCIENCDGTIEQACENGMLVDLCCPAGVECNYGQTTVLCDDGSCVNYPDICIPDGCFEGLDCVNGAAMKVAICCDPTLCNYFPATLCDDGSCVPPGQTCAI